MWLLLHTTLLFPLIITALPTHVAKTAAFSANYDSAIPSLFSLDGGNVGVNFLGYRASAGLGGLLNGNVADGGLHAEAGTPFGQAAGAGLGGVVAGSGKAAGGLYAGATAGTGVSAAAGLAGVSAGAEQPASKLVVHQEAELIKPQTTYVEKTVVPSYVEKTIQVPSYVEKTIRVPTTVEKTIRVPTTVEKTIRVPAAPTVVEKTVQAPAFTYVNKAVRIRGGRPFRRRFWHKNVNYGGYGGFGYGGVGSGAAASYSAGFTKTANTQLINDIFNIPISTLKAVNQLVGGIAGGASGSLAVSKSVAVGK